MILSRDNYLKQLIDGRKNGLVKVITGIRRCGKSVLLTEIFHSWLIDNGIPANHIIDVAMDDRANKALLEPDAFLAYVKERITDKKEYIVLVDEVQMIGEFVSVLLSLLHIKNCDVYVTGSNSRFLSTDIATEFRGRSQEIHMQPLTFAEFLQGYHGSREDAWGEYIEFGGLPQILSLPSRQEKIAYLDNLLGTVYLADLIERNKIRDDSGLRDLLRILSSSIGSPSNPSRISKTFESVEKRKIASETLSRYITFMEEAFLISEALRYDVKGRKYIGTETKYYFSDVGLRNSATGFRQLEENHLMENIIYNELKARGFNVDVGMVETQERDGEKMLRKRYEVDFVANQGSRRYYVQSALRMDTREKEQQEKNSLTHIPDSFRKIIVTRDQIVPYHDNDGVLRIGLFDFLLNAQSLDY